MDEEDIDVDIYKMGWRDRQVFINDDSDEE